MATSQKDLEKVVKSAVMKVSREPLSGVSKTAAPIVAATVDNAVKGIISHNANQEPWYQSRVTWGSIIAVTAGLAGIAGYTFDEADQTQLVNGITGGIAVVGGLITWYGRWRAKKPIGR